MRKSRSFLGRPPLGTLGKTSADQPQSQQQQQQQPASPTSSTSSRVPATPAGLLSPKEALVDKPVKAAKLHPGIDALLNPRHPGATPYRVVLGDVSLSTLRTVSSSPVMSTRLLSPQAALVDQPVKAAKLHPGIDALLNPRHPGATPYRVVLGDVSVSILCTVCSSSVISAGLLSSQESLVNKPVKAVKLHPGIAALLNPRHPGAIELFWAVCAHWPCMQHAGCLAYTAGLLSLREALHDEPVKAAKLAPCTLLLPTGVRRPRLT